ncbi:MAG: polysaccharide deacetylase family protein [Candidatus Palauibacterales bacterium]|nr:polysaccharide deacetylase family protein [Candidatus Palauibacterales bacterium]MDP2582811.1 polysaccharide deacetylase family protein [Candidatus Palauibacterales bacterium]
MPVRPGTAAALGAAVGGVGALAWAAYAPNARLFGPVVGRGDPGRRELFLTFDDGPDPDTTPRILATLDELGVPAAFFVIGARALRHPGLVRTACAAGHEIGNHTYGHAKLHRSGPRRIRIELLRTHRILHRLTGRAPTAFRPPHGFKNPFVAREARRLGYRTFGWSVDVRDYWRPGAEVIQRRALGRLAPGAILLLHDGDGEHPGGDRGQTADALPGILREARARGYTFGRLAELIPA